MVTVIKSVYCTWRISIIQCFCHTRLSTLCNWLKTVSASVNAACHRTDTINLWHTGCWQARCLLTCTLNDCRQTANRASFLAYCRCLTDVISMILHCLGGRWTSVTLNPWRKCDQKIIGLSGHIRTRLREMRGWIFAWGQSYFMPVTLLDRPFCELLICWSFGIRHVRICKQLWIIERGYTVRNIGTFIHCTWLGRV